MFVKRLAVEAGQAVRILGEVGGYPVENDADLVLVAVIDEITEIVRCAETAGGSVIACGLVAPGSVIRMFGDRQQFDVAKSGFLDVFHQLMRQFPIIDELAFRSASP